MPVLTYTAPDAAADALRWRHSTLADGEGARAPPRPGRRRVSLAHHPRRGVLGLLAGRNRGLSRQRRHRRRRSSGTCARPATTPSSATSGLEILVETARLWRSLGHYDLEGRFRIDGVTGPDEYSAIVDNNIYTNLMAQRNLRGAADACQRHQDKARELGVTPEEMAGWRAAADRVVIPYDEKLGVHQQSEGFTEHELWDFAATRADQYPLLLHFPYFDLYRKQVVKQPDLVLAMQLFSDAFTPEQRARNFDYYERITVRDSSLSACTEAVAAADAGHLRLAFDYAAEAALMDLHDSAAQHRATGCTSRRWPGPGSRFVMGFGGMRDHGETLAFAPRLPDALTRLAFSILPPRPLSARRRHGARRRGTR